MWKLSCVLLLACSSDDPADPDNGPDAAPAIDAPETIYPTVYVVRHAETMADGTADPPLSNAGLTRAQMLSMRLATAHIGLIITSQYHRTHDTAMPTSTASGVATTVLTVDGSNDGAEYAAAVDARTPKTDVLIVGHSNTVPETVEAIAHVSVPAIGETEYNHIFAITLAPDGPHLVSATY